MGLVHAAIDRGLVPEPLLRRGIHVILRQRLLEQWLVHRRDRDAALAQFVASMRTAPVALVPDRANAQHYEVPAAYYDLVLGQRRKYSCAYYPTPATTLDEAEDAMLALTCERAQIADGQRVLELGCGWGSLSLWIAERFPRVRITAVSNSSSQRAFIERRATERGLDNLRVITADMNDFRPEPGARFDRIVSVEMFEHMRNWERLLARARTWLRDDGRMFLHVFAHRRWAYPYEDRGPSDWMSRHFFSGGMMPCHDLLDHLQIPFTVERRWKVSGQHYARTLRDWLGRHQARRREVLEVFSSTYGAADAPMWFRRWALFFLASAELFDWNGGREWLVSHQRLRPHGA